MRKGPSLYDQSAWNENTDLAGMDEEFENTSELRKRFLTIKVLVAEQKLYSDLKFLKVRSIVDENFKLDFYVQLLIEHLRRIICIEKVSIIAQVDGSYQFYTNLELRSGLDTEEDSFVAEIKKLAEGIEVEKLVDITKAVSKCIGLAEIIKMQTSNFAIRLRQEHMGQISNTVYMFHFDFESIRTMLEK